MTIKIFLLAMFVKSTRRKITKQR